MGYSCNDEKGYVPGLGIYVVIDVTWHSPEGPGHIVRRSRPFAKYLKISCDRLEPPLDVECELVLDLDERPHPAILHIC